KREHIAPSALSRRLSELEKGLGAVLFNRSRRGISLTSAGITLTGLARTVLNNLDEIHARMTEHASGLRGNVRLSAIPSAIIQRLPIQLEKFAERYPGIRIQLEEAPSANILNAVAENSVDLGILGIDEGGSHGSSTLEFRPYGVDELV